MRSVSWIIGSLFGLTALAAQAQTLQSVKVDPERVAPNETVKVTAAFDLSSGQNCNVRIDFGDGQNAMAKINQEKDAALTLTHAYAKPGKYTVKVEPKTALPVMKCLGKNQTTLVNVVQAAEPTGKTATAAGPACPDGWKLDAKSVSKKTGAFTCRAKAGTAAPATKLQCPGSLGYYENSKTGQLGCRP